MIISYVLVEELQCVQKPSNHRTAIGVLTYMCYRHKAHPHVYGYVSVLPHRRIRTIGKPRSTDG